MSGVCLLVSTVLEKTVGQTCHTVCMCRILGTCYSHVSGCVLAANTSHKSDSTSCRDKQNATYISNKLQASRCYSDTAICTCRSAFRKMGPSFRHMHSAWSSTFSTVGRRYFSQYTSGDLPPTARTIPPWRTLFFGTDWFSVQHLKMLNLNRLVE